MKKIKLYCSEDPSLIENYDKAINDNTQIWDCHHRLETDENISREKLIEIGKYYNVPAYELIFLTKSEHSSIHKHRLGTHNTKEMKINQSKILKEYYETHEHWSKNIKLQDKQKDKIRQKIIGRIHINNGIIGKMIYQEELGYYLSIGYKTGRLLSKEARSNMKVMKNRIPWNKGLKKGS